MRRLVCAFLGLSFASCSKGSGVLDTPNGNLAVWTAGAGRKIQPSTAAGPGTSITVAGVRDAWTSAQIVVRAKSGHLAGVRLALDGDLSDGSGHTLSQNDVTFFREAFVDFSSVDPSIGTVGTMPAPAGSPYWTTNEEAMDAIRAAVVEKIVSL